MNLPDHGRDFLNDIVRSKVVEVPVCDGKRTVSKLPLNDAQVHTCFCQPACTRMPKPMDVDSLCYTPEYRVVSGKFSHVRCVEYVPPVAGEEESFVIVGPGGYPAINLPGSLSVDPDYAPLTSLTLEYSNGSLFRIDVMHMKRQDLLAP